MHATISIHKQLKSKLVLGINGTNWRGSGVIPLTGASSDDSDPEKGDTVQQQTPKPCEPKPNSSKAKTSEPETPVPGDSELILKPGSQLSVLLGTSRSHPPVTEGSKQSGKQQTVVGV